MPAPFRAFDSSRLYKVFLLRMGLHPGSFDDVLFRTTGRTLRVTLLALLLAWLRLRSVHFTKKPMSLTDSGMAGGRLRLLAK